MGREREKVTRNGALKILLRDSLLGSRRALLGFIDSAHSDVVESYSR
jgi:hypothetical protein